MAFWGTARPGTHQSVAYTGTAGTITNGVGVGAYKVRVVCTTAAYVRTDSTAATTADLYMPADSVEYFTITPGQKVSALQVAANGTLHVTEAV